MIASSLYPSGLLLAAWGILLLTLAGALPRISWVELLSDARRQHLLLGTTLALLVLWMVRRDFASGLSVHFLGITSATLLLGWPTALLAASLALLGLWITGIHELEVLGMEACLRILIPVLITEACARAVERRQPRNLFVFIFLCGFFPAALAAVTSVLLGLGLLWASLGSQLPSWIADLASYMWLIAFPEGFINGMTVTALVVFCPEWLESFNRSRYLAPPGRH